MSAFPAPRPHGRRVKQRYATVDAMICAAVQECGVDSPRLAVTGPAGAITWPELARGARRVAGSISSRGLGRGDRIAVLARRDTRLPVMVAGILHSGAVYCPLEVDSPTERLRWQLEDLQPELVMLLGVEQSAEQELRRVVAEACAAEVWIGGAECDRENIDGSGGSLQVSGALLEVNTDICPEDPCYITFTSGSTGRPKAVVNTHRGVACHLEWSARIVGPGEELRVLQKAPAVFDVGIAEILNPLANGGTVVMPDSQWWMGDIDGFLDLLVDYQVSVLSMVPSMLGTLLDVMDDMGEPLERLAGLKHLLLGGEAVPSALAERCLRQIGCRVHGLYGPTEAAMDVLWVEYTEELLADLAGSSAGDGRQPSLLGLPQDNVSCYLRAEDGKEVTDPGQVGELCIAGVQVATGYWRRPELTAQSFVPSWYPQVDGGRMYCTGDLARWNQVGLLEFVGRVGDQVKIRGNRVELGEVDAALRRVPGVRQAASRVVGEDSPVLVGYVVWDQEAVVLPPTEVAAVLRESVPEYMVPSRVVALQALPLSSNGKLDRRALPDPN